MGAAKKGKTIDEKTFTLSDREISYLKILNIALQHNIFKDKLISGFLYEVCNIKFGYAEDVNLQFEIDLEDPSNKLVVKNIPEDVIEKAKKSLTEQE